MFKLRNQETKFPELYPKVERKAPTVNDKGWDKVGDFVLRDKRDFMPQVGLQEKLCACDSNIIFLAGAASMGKMQPYDAKILTPKGFTTMGELKVGSIICDTEGGVQTVERIFEHGIKPIYQIRTQDGGITEAGAEHLWRVKVSIKKKKSVEKVVTTEQMAEMLKQDPTRYGNVCGLWLPVTKPICFDSNAILPIKPYTLGTILGNGCTRVHTGHIRIYTPDADVLNRVKEDGYALKKLKSDAVGWVIVDNGLKAAIKDLGLHMCLSYDKFIPKKYLTASVQDRIELLKGLMDADGYPTSNSCAEYSTSSEKLARDVAELVRSLGGVCTATKRKPIYTYNGERRIGQTSYRLFVAFQDQRIAFNLPRKKEKCGVRAKNYEIARKITSITPAGEKQCRCIQVSNPNHLYVTDDFIVTHNTYSMLLKTLQGVDKLGFTARFISVRLQDSKKGSSIFRDGVEVLGNFADCEYNSSDYPTFAWSQWNSNLQMIHSNYNVDNPSEWDDFKSYCKKNQASYIAIDEATEIKSFKMWSYWLSRNRDSSGMKPCMVLSFNPEHEHWTTQMLKDAGYIGEDWYIKPHMNGVTRYCYLKGDTPESMIWGDTVEEVAEHADIHISEKEKEAGITIHQIVKSFTFFTGEAGDNKKLIAATGGQSIGNLHAVGGTQRSILHGAYFGPVENEALNVSRQMIHNLWTNPQNADENMYATLDVSGGKTESDDCPMIIWRGLTAVAIRFFRGTPKELVDWIDKILNEYKVPVEHFAYDATGIGYYLTSYTSGMPITANRRVIQEIDENGNPVMAEQYFNLRSQLLGKTKVLLEKGEISTTLPKDLVIPYGKKGGTRNFIDVLFDEMNVFRTTTRNNKIYYRNKDEYIAKFHASPNIMDTVSYRAIFELDARPKKQPEPEIPDDAYDGFYNDFPTDGRAIWV